MGEHPINKLMETTMSSIRSMVDVNTIVGDAVETPDGSVIIPISKVSFGFASGGSDFASRMKNPSKDEEPENLFGGGSGAGVSISPVAFLVVGGGQIKLLPVNISSTTVDRVIDQIPHMIEKVNEMIRDYMKKKRANKDDSGE